MGPVDSYRSASGTTDGATDGLSSSGSVPFIPVPYGRYHLIDRVGAGGMAEVFLALMTGPEGFKRELVVKRILPRLNGNPEFIRMFIDEAKISAMMSHPNIVQIYEFGEAEGSYFISMESVYGVTLRTALTRLRELHRPMPFLVAAEIARQICVGLDYAHTLTSEDGTALEIVHQDISPTNIMLAHNGTVKILDFGIARAASVAKDEQKRGLIKGKVAFLSPEQLNREVLDHRVDIFALGIVMHEMLTGARLFQPKNDIGKMKMLLEATIHPPSAVNASVPRELDRIVMKALQKDRERRYPSAAAMANDLERTLIAARASSRDLSKMLAELFLPAEDPLVITEAGEADTDRHRAAALLAASGATQKPGEPVPASPPPAVFLGAADAEKLRLQRARWRPRLAVLAGMAMAAVVVFGGITAWRKYGHYVLPPPGTETAAQASPAPSATPPPPPGIIVEQKPTRARPPAARRQRAKPAKVDPAAKSADDSPAPAAPPVED
ncbi:MAG TPA: serine/threonine-protein kinase [Polyangia bacterium]|jgi:serine/threonine-protein kinase|nr:serine/threonine-protein kinase [Polyangia bacterium]